MNYFYTNFDLLFTSLYKKFIQGFIVTKLKEVSTLNIYIFTNSHIKSIIHNKISHPFLIYLIKIIFIL